MSGFSLPFATMSAQARPPFPAPHHPHWASMQADIEAHLKQTMPLKQPLQVFNPMHHLVFSAPRTTVPALCLAACELVGGHRQKAMPAASALLLNLANAHAHEHLLLTDRTRPRPADAYGANIELLTGDGIVPFGFELLARSEEAGQENSERILRVIIEISRAVGSEGLQKAVYMENMLEDESDVESMRVVVEKKEGGMHACGAACGALLGGGTEEDIERLRKFGYYVGMAQGMLHRGLLQGLEELRHLALNQLQFFKDRGLDIHIISTFIHF